jgi:glycogen synthase
MRILFWSERFLPVIGGVSISASRLLPALQKRGYEFVVLTLKEYSYLPEEDDYKGIPVYRFPFWNAVAKRDLSKIIELRRKVSYIKKTFAPDLVHINFLGPSVLFHFQTQDAHRAPLLVSMDSAFPNQEVGQSSLVARTLRSADWVTCVSKASLAYAREIVPEINRYSSFIYKGIKLPPEPPKPLPVKFPRLLCLGRVVKTKGFDIALTAFASIQPRFPNSRLIIAGDGPERRELEQQAKEVGVQTAVDFVGWVHPDEVPALINTATLIVIPSRSDGLPNVAKEAALMARPVVAMRVGAIPEIVVHRKTGLLVEPADASALAQAVNHLLDHPVEAKLMGQAARVNVQEVFSWESYVVACDTLYKKLQKKLNKFANVGEEKMDSQQDD